MKKIEHTTELEATPEEVFEYLLGDEFVDRLREKLGKVSKIEHRKREQLEEGRLKDIVRYTAPTRLPGILGRFKSKAPDEVQWDEVAIVYRDEHRMDYEVIPEMPDHWHERYDSHGNLTAASIGHGRCRVHQSMEYSIDAPTGFGMFLNRALKSELNDIFETRAAVLQERFNT